MSDIQIDKTAFAARLKKIYECWKTDVWQGANSFVIVNGQCSEERKLLKTIALHHWLFGYELPDTLILCSQESMHVVASKKKAELLESLSETAQSSVGIKMVFHIRQKGDNGSGLVETVLREGGSKIAILIKEQDQLQGKFHDMFRQKLKETQVALVEAAPGFSAAMASKDQAEQMKTKKAAYLVAEVVKKFLVQQVESIIEKGMKIKHSSLCKRAGDVIQQPTSIGVKLKAENTDMAYPPQIQSGGAYNLRPGNGSDDNMLNADIIICQVGAKYSLYCANIVRTLLVDPGDTHRAQYEALLLAHKEAIKAMKPGNPLSAPYAAIVSSLQASGQSDLIPYLAKNAGHSTGIEFKDSQLQLGPKAVGVIPQFAIFNVYVAVQGIQNVGASKSKASTFSMMIGDTVLVTGNESEVLTSMAPKEWKDVFYQLDDTEQPDGAIEDLSHLDKNSIYTNGRRTRRGDDGNGDQTKTAEAHRQKKQRDILTKLNEETYRRLTLKPSENGDENSAKQGKLVSEVVSYRGFREFPNFSLQMIQTDRSHKCILVPFFGVIIPFHVSVIKQVTQNQDSGQAYIRINFNYSGTTYDPAVKFPYLPFLKDLTFKTPDIKHATKLVQEIKILRQEVSQKDKETAERASLVKQEQLHKGKKVYQLRDLWIRPQIQTGKGGRKISGRLEAHQNGFRYQNPKGEVVDIMYRNIKHAFFQPAENELITVLHFNLRNPIMVGKKKSSDVQVYAEVMETTQALDGGRRLGHDVDEIEEEQRERERRNKINNEFRNFTQRIQEIWEKEFSELRLEFDSPFRDLGFFGVPNRSTVFIMPTLNAVVELVEMPFLVISLEDVQLVNLERVGFNLRNFDMAIIFKDYKRDPKRIDAIPGKFLDTIKDWLNECSIKYYESKMNLSWRPILRSITEDPEKFIQEGGWEFLDINRSDDEDGGDDGSEVSDMEFKMESEGGSERVSSSEDESSDEESVVDSADEGSEDNSMGEEEEEEGMDWDELEKEAIRQDRERPDSEDDSEEERRRRRKRAGGHATGNANKRTRG